MAIFKTLEGTYTDTPLAGAVHIDHNRLPRGTQIQVPGGPSIVTPTMDLETYSTAGLEYEGGKWRSILGKGKQSRGLKAVGAFVYAEHPSTEILSLAYDLRDGIGERLWLPGMLPPSDLFEYLAGGDEIEAHNALFEFAIWVNVAVKKLGWDWLPLQQIKCSMAAAAAHGIPLSLDKAAAAMGTMPKEPDGQRLIKLFSVPRNPTKTDPRLRIRPDEHPDGPKLYNYNIVDIRAEHDLSVHIPGLSEYERRVYEADKAINTRGCYVDLEAVEGARKIVAAVTERSTARLIELTGGAVDSATKIQALRGWLSGRGVHTGDLSESTVNDVLKIEGLPGDVQEVLSIRQEIGSTSVSKVEALYRRTSNDGRIRGIFTYCGAGQTGRWSGGGVQPQNLPSDGCPVVRCGDCGAFSSPEYAGACNRCQSGGASPVKWGPDAAEFFLEIIKRGDVGELMQYTNRPIKAITGCLRGMFTAAPGNELHGCDFSAIEAVVLACLAGEQWRIDLFNDHGRIYEMSAAQISGVPFEEIMAYKALHGDDHPLRKTVGKVAELASGYQGGLGAWKQFGADAFMSDDEIKAAVKKWREANPAIVAFWYGLEDCAKEAIRYPGRWFQYRSISYAVFNGILFCALPSGRTLKYHSVRLVPYTTPWGRESEQIQFYGVDAITKQWGLKDTYGGRLAENICQGVARDIQAHGIVNAHDRGVSVVLHVHDELTAEAPIGAMSADTLAACMNDLPAWCADWPVRVPGGWTGKRYRKD